MTHTRDTRGTLRVAPPIAPPHGLLRGDVAFVGRGDELMQLDALYIMMLGGRRQVVCVEADIGVGKTSLVDAFVARVAAQHAWPAFVSSGASPHAAFTRHATMPSVTLSLGAARILADDLSALAIDRPVLLVLEDLHAADLAMLDLVNRLAHGDDALHLMVVATARPEACAYQLMTRDFVELGVARALRLAHLDYDETRLYLAAHAPHRLHEARALHHLTSGHPGALAELVAHPHSHAPDAVRQLVAHQLARVTTCERRVLFAAAAGPEEFNALDVALTLGVSPDDVDLTCDDLAQERDFLVAGPLAHAADGRVSGSYRFMYPAVRSLLRASTRVA